MSPPEIGNLTELESRIVKKIVFETPDPREHHDCWIWRGSVTPARALRARPKTFRENAGFSCSSPITFGNDREVPTIRDPDRGYAVPAHRYIYAKLTKTDIRDVPRLGRCAHDRCVSPHHVYPRGPIMNRGTAAPREDTLAKLITAFEAGNVNMDETSLTSIERQAGLRPGLLTHEILLKFHQWTQALD